MPEIKSVEVSTRKGVKKFFYKGLEVTFGRDIRDGETNLLVSWNEGSELFKWKDCYSYRIYHCNGSNMGITRVGFGKISYPVK